MKDMVCAHTEVGLASCVFLSLSPGAGIMGTWHRAQLQATHSCWAIVPPDSYLDHHSEFVDCYSDALGS